MKKPTLKKLNLKKETIATLSSKEQNDVKGGFFTSLGNQCSEGWTGEWICCGDNGSGYINCSVSNCGCTH